MRNYVLLLILLIPFDLLAQGRAGGQPDGFSLGIITLYRDSYYKDRSGRFLPVPAFAYKKGRFTLRGFIPSYRILGGEKYSVSLALEPNFFGGYEAEDSTALTGMDERKGSLDMAVHSRFKLRPISMSLGLSREILGLHRGGKAKFRIGSAFPLNVLFKSLPFTLLSAKYGLNFYDQNYFNYYFGVKLSEATATRPAFSTPGVFTHSMHYSIRTKLSEKWMANAGYELEFLSKRFKASPIVERSSINKFILGFIYSF